MAEQRGGLVVAIDGPAGAGKSTVAQQVAERTGLARVDTGAIYRAVALVAEREGISLDDEEQLAGIARALPISFAMEGGHNHVYLEREGRHEDVSHAIRVPTVSMGASEVSRHPKVRAALLELQRRLGRAGAVLDGRDVGTVVFPDAPVKIFLTASPEERARRRTAELAARGQAEPYDKVLAEIIARDRKDIERAVAPLKPAPDAIELDSTALSLREVVDAIVERVEQAARTLHDSRSS